jgi:hypothetical protein
MITQGSEMGTAVNSHLRFACGLPSGAVGILFSQGMSIDMKENAVTCI